MLRKLLTWCCLIGALALASPRAAAQVTKLEAATLDSFQANFDFLVGMDFEVVQVNGVDQQPLEAQKYVLGQRLGLLGEGSFVHPKFWYWRAMANVLFLEDLTRGDLADNRSLLQAPAAVEVDRLAIEPEFDVKMSWFNEHPYSFAGYGSRHTRVVRRMFQSNYWLSTWTAGASAGWRNKVLPFSVTYDYHLNEGVRDELSAGDEQHQVHFHAENDSTRSRTFADYRYTQYRNRFFPVTDFDFHFGELLNRTYLDHDEDYLLESSLRGQNRDYFESVWNEVRLSERLIGMLVPSLRLRVQYDLAWWAVDAADNLQNFGRIELRHELWKSLTTSLGAHITHDLGEASERLDGGVAGLIAYRKRLGDVVEMRHSYQVAANWGRAGADPSRTTVIDLPVELVGETPTALPNRDVDPDSLQVIDQGRTVVYFRGRDFDVEMVGGLVYLRRLTGGDIPDGASVLVTYDYSFGGYETSSLLDNRYSARFETVSWEHVKLFAEYSYRDVTFTSGVAPDLDLAFHHLGTGVAANYEGFAARAEYRFSSADALFTHQLSASASYTIPITSSFRPLIGVRELYIKSDIAEEEKNYFGVFTEGGFPFAKAFWAGWRLSYSWQQGGANDGHSLISRVKIQYRMRKLLAWLEYATYLEDRTTDHYERHSISLVLRRIF